MENHFSSHNHRNRKKLNKWKMLRLPLFLLPFLGNNVFQSISIFRKMKKTVLIRIFLAFINWMSLVNLALFLKCFSFVFIGVHDGQRKIFRIFRNLLVFLFFSTKNRFSNFSRNFPKRKFLKFPNFKEFPWKLWNEINIDDYQLIRIDIVKKKISGYF